MSAPRDSISIKKDLPRENLNSQNNIILTPRSLNISSTDNISENKKQWVYFNLVKNFIALESIYLICSLSIYQNITMFYTFLFILILSLILLVEKVNQTRNDKKFSD